MNLLYGVIIFLLLIENSFALSLDIDLQKNSYSPGETIQADIQIDGELCEELSSDQIKLYCMDNSESIAPFLINVESGHYFLYFDTPLDISNKSCALLLEDVIYCEGGSLNQFSFNTTFNISSNFSAISVAPAGIRIFDILIENTFEVFIKNNRYNTTNISVFSSSDFIEISKSSILLDEGDATSFEVYLSPILINTTNKEEVTLVYDSNYFSIPIWLFYNNSDITKPNNASIDYPLLKFDMDVDKINFSISQNESRSGYISIKNIGQDLNEIFFNLSGNITKIVDLQSLKTADLKQGNIFREYIYINQKKNSLPGNYSGGLNVSYQEEHIFYPIFIEIMPNIDNKITGNQSIINGTSDRTEENKGLNIWWYILIFFIFIFIIIYFLYKKRTSKRKFIAY